MKRFFLFSFLAAVVFSCQDDLKPEAGCDVDNVFEIPWLAEQIEGLEKSEIGKRYSYLLSGQYGAKTVFIFNSCCPYCSMTPPMVYDCAGNELGRSDSVGEDIQNLKVIWEASEYSCGS
ncbi:hypothetical protein J0A68_19590 [Algoriphagus sp. H41]|uniref:Uncharacterized protein n=1 Tax=Algoriphagus oliviformis TaxID=2811231 RepID=A0ABS3C812_9BACT|nr:hypothetical protein [Algoriphagus oliviformis]MBN7813168.1 hypothetical protein [Algoriphagus oliviformis]